MQLTHNTILITGGTSGIGLSLGRSLLQLGNNVILLGRNLEKMKTLQEEGFYTLACDLSNTEEIEKVVTDIQNKFPRLNMLFNNAGVQYNYDFADAAISPAKIAMEINTNVTGQLVLTQLLIPLLHNAHKACIINTTSGLGAYPKADGLVYSAGKAAMRNFTTGLRDRLLQTNISVFEFIPPVTDTGMTARRAEQKMSAEELVQVILPQLKRERKILTVPKMRLFLPIAFLFPALARKILSK